MKRSQLSTGMIVETRGGGMYTIMLGVEVGDIYGGISIQNIMVSESGYMFLSDYYENLVYKHSLPKFDIVKAYRCASNVDLLKNGNCHKHPVRKVAK